MLSTSKELTKKEGDKMQVNYVSLLATLLGAVKLTANVFGIPFINDDQINAIVNLLAVCLTTFGILYNHFKSKQ